MKTTCPVCKKLVWIEEAWVAQHREPDSSAICSGSGVYVDEFRSPESREKVAGTSGSWTPDSPLTFLDDLNEELVEKSEV